MNWTKEDIDKVEKFIEIKNKGYYCDGGQLTEVYNRVLNKNVNSTSCGSCLRGRISELEAALNRFKEICKRQEEIKASEALKEEKVDNVTPEENKETVGHSNEATADENKSTEKKRVGRPKKS